VINNEFDVDAFEFSSPGGEISISATRPYGVGPLDIELTLSGPTGEQVGRANPPSGADVAGRPIGLDASLTLTGPPGKYRVSVRGASAGNPKTDGYSKYGSVGNFDLQITQTKAPAWLGGTAGFVPVTPCRLLDTRTNGGRALANGQTVQLSPRGHCGIPADPATTAIEVTLTAVTPTGSGYAKLYPFHLDESGNAFGVGEPNASFLNFTAGQNIANTGTVGIAYNHTYGGYQLSLKNVGGSTHYVLDVQGYYTRNLASAGFVPVSPCNKAPVPSPRLASGAVWAVQVKGTCSVPADAVAVVATIRVNGPTANGYVKAYPNNAPSPRASVINYTAWQGVANTGKLALGNGFLGIGPDLLIENQGGYALIDVEIHGYFTKSLVSNDRVPARFVPVAPCRVADTRRDRSPAIPLYSNSDLPVVVRGKCGVPKNAVAVDATVTAASPLGGGFGSARVINAGNLPVLFYRGGQNIANTGTFVFPANPVHGDLRIANDNGISHYVVDVQGYWINS
jgi:hypothetical protein